MLKEQLILVADENKQNLEILGSLLKEKNYKTALIDEGQKVLDFLQAKDPDLILLDIMISEIDAFEICKRLKDNSDKEIPIIFTSPLKDIEKKLKAFEVGGVDYITKPFQPQEVLARIKKHLELSETKTKLLNRNKELEYRIRLENLTINLSKRFIKLKDKDIENTIEEELKKIAKFIKAEYSYIYLYSEDKKEIINSFKWSEKNIKLENKVYNRSEFNLRDFPYVLEKLEKNKIISISDVNNLSNEAEELKKSLLSQGVKASLMIPLKYDDDLTGVFGFDILNKRRDWQEEMVSLIRVIGDIFVNVLEKKKNKEELSKYYKKLARKNIELERLYDSLANEFEKGSRLHQQFLPSELPQVAGIAYDTYFQPSAKLGGDFYNVVELDGQLLFYLVDVSGHGLDGSMLNIFLRETINNYLLYQHQAGTKLRVDKLLDYVDERYRAEDFPADYFICLLVGVLDIEDMELTFVNAGFQFPPLIVSKTGQISTVSSARMPITSAISDGLFMELEMIDYQSIDVSLQPGSTLFLTTDGLIEEEVKGEVYGEQRLRKVLALNYALPSNLIAEKVKADFKKFSGSLTGQDDLTFLVLQRELELIDKFETKIASNIQAMYQIRKEIEDFITPYYETTGLLCIGLQEIVSNAIEHGNKMDSSKKVKIKIEVTKKHFKIVVTDEGSGFNWQDEIDQNLDIKGNFAKERGRGIKISRKVYDEVYYNKMGNQAHLLKLRTDEKVGDGNEEYFC